MDLVIMVIIVLHLLLALVYSWDWFESFGRIQEAVIRLVISLFLPLIGVLTLKFVDHFYDQSSSAQMDELYLGHGALTDELQLLRAVDERSADASAPAVDVLSLGGYDARRRMVMDTLGQPDTADYMSVLRTALGNDDQETSHYASVVIMDVQQRMQDGLAARERALKENPGDPGALGELEEELYRVITSGALDENSLPRHYARFREVSDELLAGPAPEPGCFHRRIAIDLRRHDDAHAKSTVERFVEIHPDCEDAVLDTLRVCVRMNDRAWLDRFLSQLGSMPVMLTERTLRYIRFWNQR